jgi:4-amino-4-deoxychorismate lyase
LSKNSFLETIKVIDGEILHISYHQKRYESVLKHFGIDIFQDLHSLLNPPKVGLYKCRLEYTLDNTITITYSLYEKRKVHSLQLVYDDIIEYAFKSTDRKHLNHLFTKKGICDDVLIIKNGYVTDTTIANIAFFDGDQWVTPASALLKGITRQRLLDEGKIKEAFIKVESLKKFSKVALLNAMIDFDIITDISFKV